MKLADNKGPPVERRTAATQPPGVSLAAVGHAMLMLADRGVPTGLRLDDRDRPRTIPGRVISMLPTRGGDTWPEPLDASVDEILAPVRPHRRGRARRGSLVDVAYVPAWLLPDPDLVVDGGAVAGIVVEPEDTGPRLYRRPHGPYAASSLPDGVTPAPVAAAPEPEPELTGIDIVAALLKEDEEAPAPVDPGERQALLQDLRFLDEL
jgi:hypothetical protein